MTRPFTHYLPRKQKGEYIVERIFSPELVVRENSLREITAHSNGKYHKLLTIGDVAHWDEKLVDAHNILKARMGERILTTVLEAFIDEMVMQPGSTGSVLQESQKYSGRELIAGWSKKYALKHRGRRNFVVLEKPLKEPSEFYKQEKYGKTASELDGLAYMDISGCKFIVIGEAKTSDKWSPVESSKQGADGTYRRTPLEERVVQPLKKIFPDHEMVYLLLGQRETLYKNDNKLGQGPVNLHKSLASSGVETIFVPFPEMPKSLDDYAGGMVDALQIVQQAKKLWVEELMKGIRVTT